MELEPDQIKERISELGVKQATHLLREWIINSNDLKVRLEALRELNNLDIGKNFKFLEQLFLSDEMNEVRVICGKILKENYLNHKKIIPLMEFILANVSDLEQKLLALEVLNLIDSPASKKVIHLYLKNYIKKKLSDKNFKFPKEIFISDYQISLSPYILEVCANLIMYDYYTYECGYNVTLRDGIIILMNCEGSNLTNINEIRALDKLTKLEHLLIQRNHIKRIQGLENLKNLKTLNLSNNNIKHIENLESLTNLEELYLSDNEIEEIKNLESLKSLKLLFLDGNIIKKIENLDNLSNLESLNLNNNKLSKIHNLNELVNLKRLNFSFNNITLISGLQKQEKLIWLHLSNNQISQIEGLNNLMFLKVLNLTNNKIEIVENLDNLTSLLKLELSNNKIKKIQGLDNLKNLQELFLDKNSIKEFEGIEKLEKIIILFLENNDISEFSLKKIENLNNLNFIFLNDNPLTPNSWASYKKWARFP
ncbi:MAG: leucine-rich repeat domain-containing protein [Candidatus Hermodarchaeota archaeon]